VPLSIRTGLASAAAIVLATASIDAADSVASFRKTWEGRIVTVQRTLFTLVYDELGRVGATHRGKRDGLIVSTPSKGSYLLFSGRQSQEDIVSDDPDRLIDQVKTTYRRNQHLQIGHAQVVTPLHVIQYPRGVQLVVQRIDIERSAVRLVLHKADPPPAGEFATTLTVEWPAPLSKNLDERAPLERVIQQFLAPAR
jgi:hypothetical protein